MPSPPPNEPEVLRAYLAQGDVPCPRCGYSLRGLTTTRCPECNQELVLRVGLAEPKVAALAGCVVGFSLGLGFCALSLGFAVLYLLRSGTVRPGPRLAEMLPLLADTATCAGCLFVLVRKHRWLRELAPARRWAVVGLLWLVATAFPVWFFLVLH